MSSPVSSRASAGNSSGDGDRGSFRSPLGFILAAAGSAIGLGNIWRFPYTAGTQGGGAFVLMYLFFVLAIGVPVLYAELAVGRNTRMNPVGAYRALAPPGLWPLAGGIGVLSGLGILAFYSAVAGLTCAYLVRSIAVLVAPAQVGAEGAGEVLHGLTGNPWIMVGGAVAFLLFNAVIVQRRIDRGVELAAKILMPVFFLLLVGLAIRSLTLDGASEGLRFLFWPDFENFGVTSVMSALGQALFSLSVGMGGMITYASYLKKGENLSRAGAAVAGFDTIIALLAGVVIFPALFSAGLDPAQGPGLVFVVLPTLFSGMPLGGVLAAAFFALLVIAALTSTIGLLEVVVAYLVDEHGVTRVRAAWGVAGVAALLAIPSALSLGAHAGLSALYTGPDGKPQGFLDLQSMIWGDYSLAFGGIAICLLVGWVWGADEGEAELRGGGHPFRMAPLWRPLVRWICPIAILVIALNQLRAWL